MVVAHFHSIQESLKPLWWRSIIYTCEMIDDDFRLYKNNREQSKNRFFLRLAMMFELSSSWRIERQADALIKDLQDNNLATHCLKFTVLIL
jgi:DNA-binding PucR family transcriptional regulator